MSPRILAISGALLIALAVPAGAKAAVTIEQLSKPCYVTAGTAANPQGEAIVIKAHGFTGSSLVDIAFDGEVLYPGRQTDANGDLGVLSPLMLPAPFIKKGSDEFTMTLTEQGNPANTATVTGRHTALGVKVKPQRARPNSKIRFSGAGFTKNKPVYAHYVYDGKVRKTVRMSGDPNRCGEWSKRARQIPVSDPDTGVWTVQFDQLKKYREPGPNFPSVYVQLQISVTLVQG
ncbi:MAG TPA: hypothetical protein VD836_03965 [Solirubrobacteraceae bacterium]|nr:hypothetical protein [Solirubrobacteraceae bacterium]